MLLCPNEILTMAFIFSPFNLLIEMRKKKIFSADAMSGLSAVSQEHVY